MMCLLLLNFIFFSKQASVDCELKVVCADCLLSASNGCSWCFFENDASETNQDGVCFSNAPLPVADDNGIVVIPRCFNESLPLTNFASCPKAPLITSTTFTTTTTELPTRTTKAPKPIATTAPQSPTDNVGAIVGIALAALFTVLIIIGTSVGVYCVRRAKYFGGNEVFFSEDFFRFACFFLYKKIRCSVGVSEFG